MAEIEFLNIDLDIESSEDISPIVSEWEGKVSIQRHGSENGRFFGSFETGLGEPNEIIFEFTKLVEGLSPGARAIWDSAHSRIFDFGYESGHEPSNFHSEISPDSISCLARIGGSIAITIYPVPAT